MKNEPLNLTESKKASFLNALVIGIMVGVIIWSIVKDTVGIFTLFPLFIIYKLINNSKKNGE